MDFATSNLRGARRPLYMCGAEVIQNIPIGPVAGTAFNITTVSYNGSLDIGLAIDPEPSRTRLISAGAWRAATPN